VENLFAIMSRAVSKYRAKNHTELAEVVQRVFDDLPDSTVSGLVNSFRGRLEVVKGLDGEVPARQPLLHARRGKKQEV
jgi:RecJ-like exonuclease